VNLKYVRENGTIEWVLYDNGGVPIWGVVTDYARRTQEEEWEQLRLPVRA
jgi:hypothetical protein